MKNAKLDFFSTIHLKFVNNATKVVQNVLDPEKKIVLNVSNQKNYLNSNVKNIVLNILILWMDFAHQVTVITPANHAKVLQI